MTCCKPYGNSKFGCSRLKEERVRVMRCFPVAGAKLLTLKERLQLAMAQRRREERARKAELNRLDNEEDEDEEEEEMTDSEGEEVTRVYFTV